MMTNFFKLRRLLNVYKLDDIKISSTPMDPGYLKEYIDEYLLEELESSVLETYWIIFMFIN